jgi:hypothetical protein
MKKITATIVIALVAVIAYAQSTAVEATKTLKCNKTDLLLDALKNEYNESPVWAGTDENSTYGLLTNHETGTWTMIQFDKDMACVLGVGKNSHAMSFGKTKNSI